MWKRGHVFALSAGAAVLIALAGWSFRHTNPATAYLTASVERGDLHITLSAIGSLSAVVTVQVGSQLSGQVAELLVDFNDEVREGQQIATIDPRSFAARLREAEAAFQVSQARLMTARSALDQAKAQLARAQSSVPAVNAKAKKAQVKAEDAKRDLARAKRLRSTYSAATIENAIALYESAAADVRELEAGREAAGFAVVASEAAMKMAEADLQNAEAALNQQAAVLEQAQIELSRTVIRAPINGVVISRDVDVGQTVAASLEAPTLFTIAQDLRQMQVLAAVDEADIGKVSVGQRARFTVDAYPGRDFEGVVKEIQKAPRVTQNVVTYTVVLSANNSDLVLLPGMTAIVRVFVESAADVVAIPNAALRFSPPEVLARDMKATKQQATKPSETGDAARVWVPGDNREPRPVKVRIGRSDADVTELIAGPLQIGQEVIVGTATSAREPGLLDRLW